jgi:nitrogen regulatory protein PII
MTLSEVREWDRRGAPLAFYRGAAYVADLRPKVKVEVMVEDEEVKGVADILFGVLRTGHLSDGQITILSAETVIRVRTGVQDVKVMNQRTSSVREKSRAIKPHNQGDRARVA